MGVFSLEVLMAYTSGIRATRISISMSKRHLRCELRIEEVLTGHNGVSV